MRITFTISHSSETTLKPVPPKAHLFESLPLFPEADLNVLPDTDDKAELQVFQQVKDPLFRKTAICRQTDSRWRNGLELRLSIRRIGASQMRSVPPRG